MLAAQLGRLGSMRMAPRGCLVLAAMIVRVMIIANVSRCMMMAVFVVMMRMIVRM
jgi:hypothetical protein